MSLAMIGAPTEPSASNACPVVIHRPMIASSCRYAGCCAVTVPASPAATLPLVLDIVASLLPTTSDRSRPRHSSDTAREKLPDPARVSECRSAQDHRLYQIVGHTRDRARWHRVMS